MKRLLLSTFGFLSLLISCTNNSNTPKYYRNLNTGEVFNQIEFQEFKNSLFLEYQDSLNSPAIDYTHSKYKKTSDSIIENFKYDIRVGDKYIVRTREYPKIGMKISPQKFTSLNGEEITIGGNQEKPTLINLWFIECPGCIQEMPALNELKEKYANKVNFVALTPDNEQKVLKFLKRKEFNFKHIVNVEDFIQEISSFPYPENIFIDTNGTITHIESIMDEQAEWDTTTPHFEQILNNLLKD